MLLCKFLFNEMKKRGAILLLPVFVLLRNLKGNLLVYLPVWDWSFKINICFIKCSLAKFITSITMV